MALTGDLRPPAGQSAEDVPLGHLKPHGNGGYPGDGRGETCDVGFHVTQKLLQLFENWRKQTRVFILVPPDVIEFKTAARPRPQVLPLCRTALAGLFPDMDSLLRCWWDSARHSTSLKRVFRAIDGWAGSSVMFRYAALRSCSSITSACSNNCTQTSHDMEATGRGVNGDARVSERASSGYLEPACQKLVLNLQEVSSAHLAFEGLIEDGKPHIVLHVLPPSVTVSGRRPSQGHRRVNRRVMECGAPKLPWSQCDKSIYIHKGLSPLKDTV